MASLDPGLGSEALKTRPVVVVSNNGANQSAQRLGRGVITIVPVTSSVATVHPFQVFLDRAETGLRADSKAQAEQVRSIDVRRLLSRVGSLSPTSMAALEDALRLHLSL